MKRPGGQDAFAYRAPILSADEFLARMNAADRPVILLEGIRDLPPADRPHLVAMARWLAGQLPHAVFRTGGARGADDAFAEGVRAVDPARLEYVLPRPGHRAATRDEASRTYSLETLDEARLGFAADQTSRASPQYERLVSFCLHGRGDGASAAKARYLLRDTLKVTGAPEMGLPPASAGLFYVNEANPLSGGTGHTVRVCLVRGIPALFQRHWLPWLEPGPADAPAVPPVPRTV